MNYWTMERELDQQMFEFRHKGMNGTQDEREKFLKEIFHGVRFNDRVAIAAATVLGKTQREVFDALSETMPNFAAEQAEETGFGESQTKLYVEAHTRAYESLAEEFGFK